MVLLLPGQRVTTWAGEATIYERPHQSHAGAWFVWVHLDTGEFRRVSVKALEDAMEGERE